MVCKTWIQFVCLNIPVSMQSDVHLRHLANLAQFTAIPESALHIYHRELGYSKSPMHNFIWIMGIEIIH